MSQPDDPRLIDLNRYKKAAQARAKKQAAAAKSAARGRPAAGGREPILGKRPRAGLILALGALAFLLLWVGPRLLHAG